VITPDDVLEFWFGWFFEDGSVPEETSARWWTKDPAFDASIRERFGEVLEAASRGELDAWKETPSGVVALVVVLDQLSRNAYRDTPRAFANDARALALAEQAYERGDFDALPPMQAYFLAMPFMHAESLAAQERCITLFRRLAARAASEKVKKTLEGGADFAERHRAIVERFGRFPHRNAILGRESTPEELAFLEQPGSSF
jgi:uncharacterized protein (DUF924 family)